MRDYKYEVEPYQLTREDESNGGVIGSGLNGGTTRLRGRLAGGVRDKITMGQMKARMASLWKDGKLYATIADAVSDEFGLEGDHRFKANNIHYHIKEMLRYWRETSLLSVDERQAMLLARLDQLEMLITEAYFASMQGKQVKGYERQINRILKKPDEALDEFKEQIESEREGLTRKQKKRMLHTNGELEDLLAITEEKIKEVSRVEDVGYGDPKLLKLLLDVNDRRARLWQMYNRKDGANADQEMAKLSDDQRVERMAAILHNARMRKSGDKGRLAPAAPLGGFKDGTEAQEISIPEEKPTEVKYPVRVPEIEQPEIPEIEEEDEWDIEEDEDDYGWDD